MSSGVYGKVTNLSNLLCDDTSKIRNNCVYFLYLVAYRDKDFVGFEIY